MSERSLSEAEFDLLADYTAGVLGEPEADEVAALIERDPVWGDTHAAMVSADDTVRAALAAEVDEPMPAYVADRITAALAELAPPTNVVSLDAARSGRRRLARRVLAAAAAMVAIVGGIGVASAYLRSTLYGSDTASPAMAPNAGGGAGMAEDSGAQPQTATGFRVTTSGTDYRANTLTQITPPAAAAGPPALAASGGKNAEPQVPDNVRQAAPAALARLTDPDSLATCLAAIVRVHPGTATYAEYARFEGAPALIVVVSHGTASTVVAVGPDCGLNGPQEKAFVLVP